MDSAAERVAQLGARINALRDRRNRLANGACSSVSDLAAARAAAEVSVVYAVEAFALAAEATQRSAGAHRELAKVLDREGHHARAEEHRRAAAQDEAKGPG